MKIIPWRVLHFFNKNFHSLYMILKFGKTDLNTNKYWDKRFQFDNYHESKGTENVFRKMRELISRDSKVLDVGCGTGYFLKSLKNNQITNNVHALDISKIIIEKYVRKAPVRSPVSDDGDAAPHHHFHWPFPVWIFWPASP